VPQRLLIAGPDGGKEMPHDQTKRGVAVRGVDVNQEHEVEHWNRLFGCNREDLIRATTKVGPLVADLEWELGFRRRPKAANVD